MSKTDRAHKIAAAEGGEGDKGQLLLAGGKDVALRLWAERPGDKKDERLHSRDYEVVGYVIEGSATLHLDGEEITLRAGDSWLVPAGTKHRYRIVEPFRAIEATSPPAR